MSQPTAAASSPSTSPSADPDLSSRGVHFAILGAGPTGLEAALAAAENGYEFTLYEASDRVAGHVHGWRHVRLFTPWSMNMSDRMRRALREAGSPVPDEEAFPTGQDLIEQLYEPLAESPALAGRLRLATRVTSIGRQGLLKHEEIASDARGQRPFRLLVEDSAGAESLESADLVLDCTGNTEPNSLGDAGIPAPGERGVGDRIVRDLPNLDDEAESWAGTTTLLVGGGHSAQTALRDLVHLAEEHPGTRLVWAMRSAAPRPQEDDPLPERQRLTIFAAGIAESPPDFVDVRSHSVIDGLRETDGGRLEITLRSGHDFSSVEVDRVLSMTGRVGDHQLYRQLQVHECYATSGPMKLAAALLSTSGASGDCLAQTSLGPESLRSPEPGFFILGSKSYGRRTDFLMKVGWQQVDEIFQLLD
ncbi:MAG: NAD(P)-binding protein [Acidobacteriota bacterium]